VRFVLNKRFFEGMSELEELSKGVLAVPVQEQEQEEVYEMTRKAIEQMKLEKATSKDVRQPHQTT